MDIGTIVTLIIAGISAVATVVIAFFTYKTIQAYDKQGLSANKMIISLEA